MRTGNAILVAFFVWMAIDLPFRIFTITEIYLINDFVGLGRNDWIVSSFLIPFVFAFLFAVYGMEKKENDIYYKKCHIPVVKQKDEEPVILPNLEVVDEVKEEGELLSDVEEHVDELLKDKDEVKT